SRLPLTAELILSVGTTLGVAALVAVAIWPTRRLHLTFRPRLRFPPGVARRAGGLALIGVIEIVAYDLSIVVALVLANGRGSTGAVVLLNYGWQVFNSVNGVLALSVALSAFPVLSAREGRVFDQTCAGSTRAVLLVSWLGAALTAAVAVPASRVLARQPDQVPQLTAALGGGRAGPGQHRRADGGGGSAGARGPPDPRARGSPGNRPGGAGRGGGRPGQRRRRRGRQPGPPGERQAAGRRRGHPRGRRR